MDIRLSDDVDGKTRSVRPRVAAAGQQVYVTWYDNPDGAFDIFAMGSPNRGVDWNPVVRLDSDEPGEAFKLPEGFENDETVELVRRAKDDDVDALNELFARYHDVMVQVARRKLGPRLRLKEEPVDLSLSGEALPRDIIYVKKKPVRRDLARAMTEVPGMTPERLERFMETGLTSEQVLASAPVAAVLNEMSRDLRKTARFVSEIEGARTLADATEILTAYLDTLRPKH